MSSVNMFNTSARREDSSMWGLMMSEKTEKLLRYKKTFILNFQQYPDLV